MKHRSIAVVAVHAAALARIALCSLLLGSPVVALAGSLSVSHAWARATPPGAPGAAYFTIVNGPHGSDTLLSMSSPDATAVEMHRSTVENGLSRMRPAQVVMAPGEIVKVEPGGLHVMLLGLKRPLTAGSAVPLLLTFQNAGVVTVQLNVQSMTSTQYEVRAAHAGH